MTGQLTVDILVQTADGGRLESVAVPAHASATPGLVITPLYGWSPVEDLWGVTHAATGRSVLGRNAFALDVAHQVATQLGALPVDWTADAVPCAAEAVSQKEAIRNLLVNTYRFEGARHG